MRRLIRRVTLGVSLVGIGLGLGGILLTPSAADTASDWEHLHSGDTCKSGCDTSTQICCLEDD